MTQGFLPRLVRTGLIIALVDGAFASVLSLLYGSTVTRLWQGVASTVLGPAALQGGLRTALVGVVMHVGVAFFWSAVFLLLYDRSAAVRQAAAGPGGAWKVAAVYGPPIWLVMSLVVVPLLVHRPPSINTRWWINLVAHVPFVAYPIVASVARGGAPV